MKKLIFSYLLLTVTGVLLLTGVVQTVKGISIPAKAWLSVALIDHAWDKTVDGSVDARPWPWMDSVPVARLEVPRLDRDLVVMNGVSGQVLAFSPGWHEGTSKPGDMGISMVSAHRDTHFGFLHQLVVGDEIILNDDEGRMHRYEVDEIAVVEAPEIWVPHEKLESVLLLTTCYPFSNWEPGGDMRYVVVARESEELIAQREQKAGSDV